MAAGTAAYGVMASGNDPAPFIISLTLDRGSHSHFDGLRRRFFPRDILHVGAHITLFHALPAVLKTRLLLEMQGICEGIAPFRIAVKGTRFLGRGVAFVLESAEARDIRGRLAVIFAAHLTPQDSARWSAHLTVQNKVAPEIARQTQAILDATPHPASIDAVGLSLWRYRGGPWESVQDFRFSRIDRI